MYVQFGNISIKGMATTLPEHEIDNMSFAAQFGEDVVKKQIKVTGITRRRVVTGNQNALDLMLHSAEKVLKYTGWTGDEIDILIFASGYKSCQVPATSFLAQKHLGVKQDCIVLDINLACTGTVDGLLTIASLLQQCQNGAKGILLVGETTTIGGAGEDKATSMLSSDCGVAVAVEKEQGKRMLFSQKTDGSRYEVLVRKDVEDFIHMDGMEVFQFAITDVVESIRDFFLHYAEEYEGVDFFIIHQAQKFIVDKVAFFADFPKDRVINSYQLYGNSGGASDICTLCANRVMIGDKCPGLVKIFMTGFGAGLSWGMVIFEMDSKNILETEYSDFHYEI